MVACLREIFLSVSTTSQSAAVPRTFFPARSRKSSPLCCPLSATSQPHTSPLRASLAPLLRSERLTIAVPCPAEGIGMGIPPPPPPPPACCMAIICCISRQYGHTSQLGCITCPFGHTLPSFLPRLRKGRMRSTICRNTQHLSRRGHHVPLGGDTMFLWCPPMSSTP